MTEVRLVLLVGGYSSGKTAHANRLAERLGRCWRVVALDNYIPWGWKDGAIAAAAKTLQWWGQSEKLPVVFEGAVGTDDHVRQLIQAYGLSYPSHSARIIQLDRTAQVAVVRRLRDDCFWPDLTDSQKREGCRQLELQVPLPLRHAVHVDVNDDDLEAAFRSVLASVLNRPQM